MAAGSKKAQNFSFGSPIKESWEIVKKNYVNLLAIFGLSIVITGIIPAVVQTILAELELTALVIAWSFINQVISIAMSLAITKAMLDIVDGKKINVDFLRDRPIIILHFFFASILYTLAVFGGMLLFILPGIYLALKYGQFYYIMVDKKIGPIAALKESARITDGVKGQIFVIGFIAGCLNILGALALLVGLFVTIPISAVVPLLVYRKLSKRA